MQSTPPPTNDDNGVALLIAMGFVASEASAALTLTAGNVEQAVNHLLFLHSGGDDYGYSNVGVSAISSFSSAAVEQVQGSISQYSVKEGGRSACTFMALVAAATFLEARNNNNVSPQPPQPPSHDVDGDPRVLSSLVKAEFLDSMVEGGGTVYSQWKNRQQTAKHGSTDVEHVSPEEALTSGLFDDTALSLVPGGGDGGIRQGLLSRDLHHPMGLLALLSACQSRTHWICVVVVKPPETVLVCLPPCSNTNNNINNTNNNTQNSRSTTTTAKATTITNDSSRNGNDQDDKTFLLIDSHPRPAQFLTQHAYCRALSSLSDLIQSSLQAIFPVTDLGDDDDGYLTTMYNSFDLYPLERR